jgi:NAD-dependent deacetylase
MQAQNDIAEADVLIVGGTSLTVYPAAGLIRYFQGEHLIIINRTPTPYDRYAELVIREQIEKVLA